MPSWHAVIVGPDIDYDEHVAYWHTARAELASVVPDLPGPSAKTLDAELKRATPERSFYMTDGAFEILIDREDEDIPVTHLDEFHTKCQTAIS